MKTPLEPLEHFPELYEPSLEQQHVFAASATFLNPIPMVIQNIAGIITNTIITTSRMTDSVFIVY